MSDPTDGAVARRYGAEELADELSRQAEELSGLARGKNDYGSAWRIARERVAVLVQLGVVDGSDPGGMTFEQIARLADEATKTE